jgi:hypothetical protein
MSSTLVVKQVVKLIVKLVVKTDTCVLVLDAAALLLLYYCFKVLYCCFTTPAYWRAAAPKQARDRACPPRAPAVKQQ